MVRVAVANVQLLYVKSFKHPPNLRMARLDVDASSTGRSFYFVAETSLA